MKRTTPWILLAGDLLALFLFIFIGQVDHQTVDQASPIWGALPQAAAFALPWLVAAWLLKGYQMDDAGPQGAVLPFLGRSLNAWLVAAPLGMAFRALLLKRATIPLPFFLVTLGLGGAFVLAWRLIFVLVWQARQRRSAGTPAQQD